MVFAPFPSIFPSPKTPLISRTDGLVRGKNENTGRSDCQDILAWRAKNGFAMRGFGSWPNEAVASDPRLSDSVVSRAGPSHSDFFAVFASEENCILAAFEEGLARLSEQVALVAAVERTWLGRVRRSLVALLGFIDDEPGYGRLLFAGESLPGAFAFECERHVQSVLVSLLEDLHEGAEVVGDGLPSSPELIGELVVGGVFSVIRTNMLEGDGGPFVELAPSLTAFVVTPYLGQAAAGADLTRTSSYNRSPAGGQTSPWPVRRARTSGAFRSWWGVPRTTDTGVSRRRARASIDYYPRG
jgi:hypothetical protein